MQRLIYTLIAATGLASPALAADAVVPEGTAGFKTAAESFIQNYCVDCHDADVQKAKFRIDDIDPNITDGKDIVRWQKVLEMVEIKNMPPEKKPQPDRDERRMAENCRMHGTRRFKCDEYSKREKAGGCGKNAKVQISHSSGSCHGEYRKVNVVFYGVDRRI